ncbi:DoxX family protein [Sphingobacterium bovistauri]|uniref:DoxX family protein n=1 Tax=Sphingobacterium bovistauri TaxID=2781959 RepID=A0ABS7Z162_9SPHI|nr:DoxX family protein [Sphingobacterium bovistauri]MCA5003905.1 DoxX family protein [Sphingobacterium bovistauri]
MSRSTSHIRKDIGLLIIRIAIGTSMLAFHGIPKILRGVESWEKIGSAMHNIGITFMTPAWGFIAILTETIGSILIIIGLFTRPTAIVLAITMLIAFISHLSKGDSFAGSSHPLELMFIFIALAIARAGKFSIDKK